MIMTFLLDKEGHGRMFRIRSKCIKNGQAFKPTPDIAQAFESASPELKQKMIEQFAKKRGFMQ